MYRSSLAFEICVDAGSCRGKTFKHEAFVGPSAIQGCGVAVRKEPTSSPYASPRTCSNAASIICATSVLQPLRVSRRGFPSMRLAPFLSVAPLFDTLFREAPDPVAENGGKIGGKGALEQFQCGGTVSSNVAMPLPLHRLSLSPILSTSSAISQRGLIDRHGICQHVVFGGRSLFARLCSDIEN